MEPLFVTTREGSKLKTKFRDLATSDEVHQPLFEYTSLLYRAILYSIASRSKEDRQAFVDNLDKDSAYLGVGADFYTEGMDVKF